MKHTVQWHRLALRGKLAEAGGSVKHHEKYRKNRQKTGPATGFPSQCDKSNASAGYAGGGRTTPEDFLKSLFSRVLWRFLTTSPWWLAAEPTLVVALSESPARGGMPSRPIRYGFSPSPESVRESWLSGADRNHRILIPRAPRSGRLVRPLRPHFRMPREKLRHQGRAGGRFLGSGAAWSFHWE